MERFARLYEAIDRTTSTNEKVAAMARFFQETAPKDAAGAAWTLYVLSGGKLKRLINGPTLVGWACEATGIKPWLFREGYSAVGDMAETISLVLDAVATPRGNEATLEEWITERLEPLRGMSPGEQRERVTGWLTSLHRTERFLLVKLLTGEPRVGVSRTLVARAVAEAFGVPPATISHRLMGSWRPTASFLGDLASTDTSDADTARPYPFFLASPLENGMDAGDPAGLGPIEQWQLEWKWDGIRAQLIRRDGRLSLWSRGDEQLAERFPDVVEACSRLPNGVVLDGELLCWAGGEEGHAFPFAKLQRRIGRTSVTRRVLADAPASFMAYDVLESAGMDVRASPLSERRAFLERIVRETGSQRLLVSPMVVAMDWREAALRREESRARGVEGLMLKRLASTYQVGRVRGDWWKWKIDPLTVEAVLVNAEPGHGRRANLLTDYTFAVWEGEDLVPFSKAYSGLTDAEIAELDRWIRQHSRGRHGPVRVVEPTQVFELAFEGISRSDRHRSGVAVRFPRISRWRRDKPASEADTIESLRRLLPAEPASPQGELFGD